jgi:hypothetical protein
MAQGNTESVMPFRRSWLRRRPSAGAVFYWAYKDAQREARRTTRHTPPAKTDTRFAAISVAAGAASIIPGILLKLAAVHSWIWPTIGWTSLIGAALIIAALVSTNPQKPITTPSAIAFTVGLIVFEVGLTLFSAEAVLIAAIPVLGVVLVLFVLAVIGMLQVGLFLLFREVLQHFRTAFMDRGSSGPV